MNNHQSTSTTNKTPQLRVPLFRKVRFLGMNNSSKKPASVSVRIMHANCDTIYVRKIQSSNTIVGFQDPKTGFFITKLRNEDTQSNLAHNQFRHLALTYAQDAVNKKLAELKDLQDTDNKKYSDKYKPLSQINQELSEFLADANDFFADLEKQIALIRSNAKPHTNEYIAYQDTEITNDMFVTDKVPYLDPRHQHNSAADNQLVENFLNEFVDEDNLAILSWYFGAMLCNLPIYDEKVSKMMIVSSSRGGSGKSTLMQVLSNALLTDNYREIKSSFDNTFTINNRFGTSQILPVRMILYSEAEFNGMPDGEHNFDGLNVSEIKSMISDGYVAYEKKYDDMQTTRLSSFQIVLTNNPPEIDKDRQALNRRLLPLIIRPNTMRQKGKQLGLTSESQINKFVVDNVQAFANYFVAAFKANPTAWTNMEYQYEETLNDIQHSNNELFDKVNDDNRTLSQLKNVPIQESLPVIMHRLNLDKDDMIPFMQLISNAVRHPKDNPNIRYSKKDAKVYLSSTKSFFAKYHLFELRDGFKTIYGNPIKKYGKRMWGIPYYK